MTNALTLPQRAAVALNSTKYEKELVELIEKSKDLTEVKDNAGRDQVHRAAMSLTNTRVSITKSGKAAREDAQAFSSAVIAEEKRLVALIKPEEDRLFAVRDFYDEKIEAEKQAKIAAEKLRVDIIRKAMDEIRDYPASCAGKPLDYVETALNGLIASNPLESFFQEFMPEIISIHETSKAKLISMISDLKQAEEKRIKEQQEREAEAARLKAEREENERVRLELVAKQKLIDEENAKFRQEFLKAQKEMMKKQFDIEHESIMANHEDAKLHEERLAFEAEKQAAIEAEQKRQNEIRDQESAKQTEIDAQEKLMIEQKIDSFAELVNPLPASQPKIKVSKSGILYAVSSHFGITTESAEQAINHYFKG